MGVGGCGTHAHVRRCSPFPRPSHVQHAARAHRFCSAHLWRGSATSCQAQPLCMCGHQGQGGTDAGMHVPATSIITAIKALEKPGTGTSSIRAWLPRTLPCIRGCPLTRPLAWNQLLQVCGVTNPQDAKLAAEAGADFIGEQAQGTAHRVDLINHAIPSSLLFSIWEGNKRATCLVSPIYSTRPSSYGITEAVGAGKVSRRCDSRPDPPPHPPVAFMCSRVCRFHWEILLLQAQ